MTPARQKLLQLSGRLHEKPKEIAQAEDFDLSKEDRLFDSSPILKSLLNFLDTRRQSGNGSPVRGSSHYP